MLAASTPRVSTEVFLCELNPFPFSPLFQIHVYFLEITFGGQSSSFFFSLFETSLAAHDVMALIGNLPSRFPHRSRAPSEVDYFSPGAFVLILVNFSPYEVPTTGCLGV